MARRVAIVLAALALLLALQGSPDAAIALGLMVLLALSMIFRSHWWTFWLPMGFWEQRASDGHRPDASGPAIVLLGWIILLLAVFLSFRL